MNYCLGLQLRLYYKTHNDKVVCNRRKKPVKKKKPNRQILTKPDKADQRDKARQRDETRQREKENKEKYLELWLILNYISSYNVKI